MGLAVVQKAERLVCRWQAAATAEPDGVPLPLGWGAKAEVGAVKLKLRCEKGLPPKDLSAEAPDRARGLAVDGLVPVRSASAMAPSMMDWRRTVQVDIKYRCRRCTSISCFCCQRCRAWRARCSLSGTLGSHSRALCAVGPWRKPDLCMFRGAGMQGLNHSYVALEVK